MQHKPKNFNSELNPNVSVDCVIFGFDLEQLTVLLIDRGEISSAFGPRLALPGNLIYDNENLDQAANRVLAELTGLENIYLEQVGAFGDPDRQAVQAGSGQGCDDQGNRQPVVLDL